MNSFPNDWIAPGEFHYCGCGHILLPDDERICAKCRYKPRLEDFACGICGVSAAMFFVHGYRCDTHAFNRKPSSAIIRDDITVTASKLLKPVPPNVTEDIARCERVHQRLLNIRINIANKRRNEGMKPLFWLDIANTS